jgi:hypothetical protein
MAQLVDGVIATSVGVFRAGASSQEGDGGGDDKDGMLEDSGRDGLAGKEAEDGSDKKVCTFGRMSASFQPQVTFRSAQ